MVLTPSITISKLPSMCLHKPVIPDRPLLIFIRNWESGWPIIIHHKLVNSVPVKLFHRTPRIALFVTLWTINSQRKLYFRMLGIFSPITRQPVIYRIMHLPQPNNFLFVEVFNVLFRQTRRHEKSGLVLEVFDTVRTREKVENVLFHDFAHRTLRFDVITVDGQGVENSPERAGVTTSIFFRTSAVVGPV